MKNIFLAIILATSAYVQSSETASLSSSLQISDCLKSCLAQATECPDYTNLSCVCATTNGFQTSVANCIQANCASDLQEAMNLHNQYCTSPPAS